MYPIHVRTDPTMVGNQHEFFDLDDVRTNGHRQYANLVEGVKRHVEEQGIDIGRIKARWVLYVDAVGWQMPKEVLPEDTTLPDYEEQVSKIREKWLSHIGYLDMANRVEPIVIDIHTGEHVNR